MCKLKVFIVIVIMVSSFIYATTLKAYKLEILPGGLTLISEKMEGSNVVVVDFWVKSGALYENENNNGASHFMEHMFFQGTPKRPGDIANYIKDLGATYNGATAFDYVHYFIEAPKEKLAESLDILGDMLANASMDPEAFENERGVILSELASRKSNPGTDMYDRFGSVIFNKEYPYSRSIGGDYDVIKKMPIDDLKYFYDT